MDRYWRGKLPVGTGDEDEELLMGCSCFPGGSLSRNLLGHSFVVGTAARTIDWGYLGVV